MHKQKVNCLVHISSFFIFTAFCYQKVKVETEEIQDRIIKELGLNPVEQDVIVLYDNEKDQTPSEFWKVINSIITTFFIYNFAYSSLMCTAR